MQRWVQSLTQTSAWVSFGCLEFAVLQTFVEVWRCFKVTSLRPPPRMFVRQSLFCIFQDLLPAIYRGKWCLSERFSFFLKTLFKSGCTDLGQGVIQGLFPATPVDFEGSSRSCLKASGFCEGEHGPWTSQRSLCIPGWGSGRSSYQVICSCCLVDCQQRVNRGSPKQAEARSAAAAHISLRTRVVLFFFFLAESNTSSSGPSLLLTLLKHPLGRHVASP